MAIKRFEVINFLIERMDYKSYLEIGTQNGECLEAVKAKKKVGVDPKPNKEVKGLVKKSSDQFFKDNKEKFDVIFIDGDHSHGQSKKDLQNALLALNKNGAIVLHDSNPPTERYSKPEWCGEVYKTIIDFRKTNPQTYVLTVDEDFGVCVIFPDDTAEMQDVKDVQMSYPSFSENRHAVLNLVEFGDFGSLLEQDFYEEEKEEKNDSNNSGSEIEIPEDTDDLKALYEEVLGKKPHWKKSDDKLREEILNELNG